MTKQEFLARVQAGLEADGTVLPRTKVAALVDQVVDTWKAVILEEERFVYPGFGIFAIKERAARTGRNPRTGAALEIAASRLLHFTPSREFKLAAQQGPKTARPARRR